MTDFQPTSSSHSHPQTRGPNPWLGRGTGAASSADTQQKKPVFSNETREVLRECGLGSSEDSMSHQEPQKLFSDTATSMSDENAFANSPKRLKEGKLFSDTATSKDDEFPMGQKIGSCATKQSNVSPSSPTNQPITGINDLSPMKDELVKLFSDTATDSSEENQQTNQRLKNH